MSAKAQAGSLRPEGSGELGMGDTGKRVGRSVVHSSFREKHGKSGCSDRSFLLGWRSLPPSSPPLCTVHALIRATGIQATNLSVAPGLAVAAAFRSTWNLSDKGIQHAHSQARRRRQHGIGRPVGTFRPRDPRLSQ